LVSLQSEVFSDAPSLLKGANFDECLIQYKSLLEYVEGLWANSCNLYERKHYPLATFTAILTIEEIGKLGRLGIDLLNYDQVRSKNEIKPVKDHRKKHFMSVVAGAVNNARLDRIFGKERIRKLLEETESGKLEELRQACLYLDIKAGHLTFPAEVITEEMAKFFTVLAGELMAAILNHFPWEFERMIESVISYEVTIGYDYEFVKRGGKATS
jgi:AbiV family abortive infection protein